MIWKAKKPRNKYKNENAWLRAVYRNNKELIDSKLNLEHTTGYRAFKALLREYKQDSYTQDKYGNNPTNKQALERMANSEIFRSKGERLQSNAWNALKDKTNKQAYETIRRLTGWKTKMSVENLRWDSKAGMYVYQGPKGKAYIDFSNSPKQIWVFGDNEDFEELENI